MKRVSQLDGVRGVAILLVLVWHYFGAQVVAEPKSILHYCTHALSLTWSGVDLFFVLSGFLIAGILLDHHNTSNYFRVFYLRRVCRIFPLYFLLLALFLCLSATNLSTSPSFRWLLHDPFPIWSYATFTQNILMGARGGFGPHWLGITWSLAVEEQFYLFVPFLNLFFATPHPPLRVTVRNSGCSYPALCLRGVSRVRQHPVAGRFASFWSGTSRAGEMASVYVRSPTAWTPSQTVVRGFACGDCRYDPATAPIRCI